MKLILGLGNPGTKYQKSRHNSGFRVIDSLAKELKINLKEKRYKSLLGKGRIGRKKIILAKPLTFMNNSGRAAAGLIKGFKVSPKHLVVIYDDIDLALGRIRIRKKGSSGGHKGVESIIQELGTDEFPRVRMGIGRPSRGPADPAEYVLDNFNIDEHLLVSETINRTRDALILLVKEGITSAMDKYNASEE